MTVRDSTGTLYFVKFDPPSNPEMATGAEVISTRLFWALGFNVPENYLATFRRDDLRIAPDTKLDDEHGRTRAMTEADVDALLLKAARNADGSYRVVASKGITGSDVGPFKYYGTRPDDPNDIHPHEHRRELRAMRVFGAWLNHDDSRAINTRDFLQESGNRKIVRHYLIDFGSTLGSGSTRAQGTRAGNEYHLGSAADAGLDDHARLLRAAVAEGALPRSAGGRTLRGQLTSGPIAGSRSTPTRHSRTHGPTTCSGAPAGVMAFSDEAILEVSRTAAFTDPEATAYMAQTLITRRDKIGQLWLNVVLPVDDFDLTADGVFTFRNIAMESKTAVAGRGYTVSWARFDNTTGTATKVGEPQVVTDPRATAPRDALSGEFVQATLVGDHPTHAGWATPTTVVFRRAGAGLGAGRRRPRRQPLGLLRSSGDSYRHGAVTGLPPRSGRRPPHGHRGPGRQLRRFSRRTGAASRCAWRSASRWATRWSCWSALAPCFSWAGRFRNWSSGRARSWAGCC